MITVMIIIIIIIMIIIILIWCLILHTKSALNQRSSLIFKYRKHTYQSGPSVSGGVLSAFFGRLKSGNSV